MKTIIFLLAVLFLLVPLASHAQTHQFCPTDATCTWTGPQTFNGPVSIPGNVSVGGTLGAKCVNGVCDLVGAGAKCDGATDDRAIVQALMSLSTVKAITAPPGLVCVVGASGAFALLTNTNCASVQGVGWKIANSVGTYKYFIENGTCSGNSFKNNVFDGNAQNNQVNSDPLVALNYHVMVHVAGGANVIIDKNITKNNNDIWTFELDTCDSCEVTDNIWTNAGVGGTFDHDTSEIIINTSTAGSSGKITGNIMTAAGIGTRTAIETDGDNRTVANNIIQGFRNCVIVSANTTTMHDTVVNGNTCSNVYKGVYLWVNFQKFDGLQITDNKITVNRNGFWPTSVVLDDSGIIMQETGTNELKNVLITGNNIRFVADSFAVNSQSAGISMVATGAPGYPLTNVTISNNTIDNSFCGGVIIQQFSAINQLTIKNNVITNPGQNTNGTTCFSTAFKTGISVILSTAQTIIGSVVENNTITDNQVSPTMQVGVRYIGVASDGSATGMVLRGDVVRYVGTPPNSNQSFLFASTSMPEVHEIIPNYDRTVSSPFSGGNPPNGSTIYDPIAGRLYTQSNLAGAGTFLSSYESRQTIPVAGKYQAGDWVFNTQPTTNGTCAWVNTVAGSPGTFVTVACSGTTTVGSGTVTTAGTAVTNGTCQAQTAITITGATTTDVGIVSLNAALPATWQTGINWATAQITANTCTISLCNGTAGSITPVATAVRCTVVR